MENETKLVAMDIKIWIEIQKLINELPYKVSAPLVKFIEDNGGIKEVKAQE